ncbi:hypothetical protein BGX38DRAFT_1286409 [Terfezia claveryi]|nr:hypothetical protein BGX38DRAFT_1286409 [Terfezia claveryi]
MRCQFCNYQFTVAGHYGRHLRKKHPGKELQLPKKPATPDPHSLSGTLKRRRKYSDDAVLRVTNGVTEHGSEATPTVLGNIRLPSIAQISSDTLSPHQCTEEYLPQSLQVGQVTRQSLFTPILNPSWNPLLPFTSAYEYKLARFFHQSKTSMKQIDQFFKDELLPLDTSRTIGVGYRSAHTWRNKMRALIDQPAWQHGTVDFHLQRGVTFFYRDLNSVFVIFSARKRTLSIWFSNSERL